MSDMCAPTAVYNKTCFSISSLKNIADKLNKEDKYKNTPKIELSKYSKNNKDQLVDAIQNKLNCTKNIDLCILNKKNDFYKDIKEFFKPASPGDRKWLSTINIKQVMEQYMKKYPDFLFYGPVPLDFALFYDELSNVNLKSLTKNKKKIGIIFNTDYSYQSGQHWISLFIDLSNKTICFFDSTGDKPPKEIITLMAKIKHNALQHNINLDVIVNKKKHQYKNSECGVYSIYFLVSRLEGKSCDMIFNNIIKDDAMNKNRQRFFRKEKNTI